MTNVAIVIHGGCGSFDIKDPINAKYKQAQGLALSRIIKLGWSWLNQGLVALDVVEKVINELEYDPTFNAGIGASIGSEKQIELDASIMDGRNLNCGAVGGLDCIPNAISVARAVMERSPHVLLVGNGATAFALKHGFKQLPLENFYTEYQLYHWGKTQEVSQRNYSTVGAVVLDVHGNLAAGTSTGGMTNKLPGRIGDSPLIGAGTYAKNGLGGASATGWGEQIIKVGLCKTAVDLINYLQLDAQAACDESIRILSELPDGDAGIIMLDQAGNVGVSTNQKYFPRAFASSIQGEPKVLFDA